MESQDVGSTSTITFEEELLLIPGFVEFEREMVVALLESDAPKLVVLDADEVPLPLEGMSVAVGVDPGYPVVAYTVDVAVGSPSSTLVVAFAVVVESSEFSGPAAELGEMGFGSAVVLFVPGNEVTVGTKTVVVRVAVVRTFEVWKREDVDRCTAVTEDVIWL